MSAKFDKGDRVGIVGGRQGKGMRGEVFWVGESRYGKGARYGVRGDDGETYWVDEQHAGAEEEVPPPELPQHEALEKGARVRITRGDGAGATGEVFWVGERRSGPGLRYGVRGDDEETYWVDAPGVEPLDEPAPDADRAFDDAPAQRSSAPAFDDAPLPDDDDAMFPEDGGFDDGEPPF